MNISPLFKDVSDWLVEQVVAQFQVKPATHLPELGSHIPSQNPLVTQFLDGGIRTGTITEWGIPLGCSGRRIIVDFVSQITQHNELCLWVNGHSDLKIHPPAWISRGVNPLKWVVANATAPVNQLKPAIMQPIFKLLVLDMAAHQLSTEDIAFIGLQARLHRYAVIIIRPHLLSNKRGNAWAKYRINVHPQGEHLHLSVVKGLQERHLTLANYGPLPGARLRR